MILFLRQLWGELIKMSARKRTYIGFAAFFVVNGFLIWLLQRPGARKFFRGLLEGGGFGFDEYWSMLSVAFIIMAATVFLLGGNYLALVLGDIVAKETEEGSFRLMMSRPVSRLRILVLKYVAGAIYTYALIFFIGFAALVSGFIHRGWGGGLFIWAPDEGIFEVYSFADGLARFVSCLPFLALSTMTVSSIAFMFSCFRMKPATATILTVSVLVSDWIVRLLPFGASFRESISLLTRMAAYVKIFERPVPWPEMIQSYAFLAGVNGTCFVIGWLAFQSRDFKS